MADLAPATGALRRSMAPPAGATRPAPAAASHQPAGSPAQGTRTVAAASGTASAHGGRPDADARTTIGTSGTAPAHGRRPDQGTSTAANGTNRTSGGIEATASPAGASTSSRSTNQPATPASPVRAAARPGRVLRAIVPGGPPAESGSLPVANRLLSDHPGAGHASPPGGGHRTPVDAPVRRQATGPVRPQHLPAAPARSASPAGTQPGQAPTQPATTRDLDRSQSSSPHRVNPAASIPPVRRSQDGAARPSTSPRYASRGPGSPVIHRSPSMPTTFAAAAAQRDRADTASAGTQPARLPGGLAAAASGTSAATGSIDQHGSIRRRNAGAQPSATQPHRDSGHTGSQSGQLGAFVNRSMVIAPPRVSIRPAERTPAAAGPPVPVTARPNSGPSTPNRSGQPNAAQPPRPGVEADGPVIRRSLAGTAHSLFRSLLRNPGPGGPGMSSDPVPSGSTDMFEAFQHAHGADGPPEPPTIRRLHESGGSAEFPTPGHDAADDSASPAMRARDFDELIDRIVAKLEQRITDDLERRGRRHLPEVF